MIHALELLLTQILKQILKSKIVIYFTHNFHIINTILDKMSETTEEFGNKRHLMNWEV